MANVTRRRWHSLAQKIKATPHFFYVQNESKIFSTVTHAHTHSHPHTTHTYTHTPHKKKIYSQGVGKAKTRRGYHSTKLLKYVVDKIEKEMQ